jgi:hypothetical protein
LPLAVAVDVVRGMTTEEATVLLAEYRKAGGDEHD